MVKLMGANNGEIWGGEKSRVTKVFDTHRKCIPELDKKSPQSDFYQVRVRLYHNSEGIISGGHKCIICSRE